MVLVDVCVVAGAAVTDPAGLQVFQPTLLDDLDGLTRYPMAGLRNSVSGSATRVVGDAQHRASEAKTRIAAPSDY
jgi:hypothetical protein